MVSLGYTTLQMNVLTELKREIPIMDRIDEDLYVISGHYRNGFTFAYYWSISPIGYSPVLNRVDMNHLVLQGG